MHTRLTFVLAVGAAFACLGMTAGSERASLSVGMNFKKLSASEGWGRVWAVGGTFYGFRIKGVDFDITGLKYVRAAGAAAPKCTVSGSPAILDCRGTFPDGSSIFVGFNIAGGGSSFQQENFFSANIGPPQFFITNTLGQPLLPISASLKKGKGASKTVTFSGKSAFNDLEVLPYGFKITRVTKSTPAASCKSEGFGIDCSLKLAKGGKGSITFDTARVTARSATAVRAEEDAVEVLLHGDDGTGDAVATVTPEEAEDKYDLIAQMTGELFDPLFWTAHVGSAFKQAQLMFSLTVHNAKDADRSSLPSAVHVQLIGPKSTTVFRNAEIDCRHGLPVVPALAPGESKEVCQLYLEPFHNGDTIRVLRTAHIGVRLGVACAKNLERSCTNNRAFGTILVL